MQVAKLANLDNDKGYVVGEGTGTPYAGNAAVLTISCGQPHFGADVGTRAADSDKDPAELIC